MQLRKNQLKRRKKVLLKKIRQMKRQLNQRNKKACLIFRVSKPSA